MKKDINLNMDVIIDNLRAFIPRLGRYAVALFLLLLVAVYGFVLLRVLELRNVQPSDADVTAQVQASVTPHVDPTVVKQMQALQDNSVNVQALFDQARNNPFQE